MSDLDLNSKQWCELVFDGKNTEFGAFQMRQESTSRHNKAMIIVAILVVLIITLPALFRYIAPKQQDREVITEVTKLTKLPPPEVKNNDVIKKADAPPPLVPVAARGPLLGVPHFFIDSFILLLFCTVRFLRICILLFGCIRIVCCAGCFRCTVIGLFYALTWHIC